MPHTPEHRRGPDRRRLPRGGRRATDRPGYAPLVLLVDDTDDGHRCEAILSKLRFAVAPARGIDEALRIMTGLQPDLIVARSADAARLRIEAPQHVRIVVPADDRMEGEALVEEIRRALRAKKTGDRL
jgi:hypothetical protein